MPPVAQKKKDEQDGSFLIIDESIKASDIPDTAIKLFDVPENNELITEEEPKANEISFFSDMEESASVSEVATSDTQSMEATDTVSFLEETSISAEPEDAVVMTSEVTEEVAPMVLMEEAPTETETVIMDTPVAVVVKEEIIETEVADIYAPVHKAIAEYDGLIARLTKKAESKDQEISDRNARIAEEKAAAKKALDERKSIESEMDRINEMRIVFTSQLKK